MLLAQAVEEMRVRPVLRQRGGRGAERALANVDAFLDMTRAYETRGLRAFAQAMRMQWSDETRAQEARPDAEREAVSLITMHAAKGLEWAVVIPGQHRDDGYGDASASAGPRYGVAAHAPDGLRSAGLRRRGRGRSGADTP